MELNSLRIIFIDRPCGDCNEFFKNNEISLWVDSSRGKLCTMELVSYIIGCIIGYFVTWLVN
jgi:hypothetical protein